MTRTHLTIEKLEALQEDKIQGCIEAAQKIGEYEKTGEKHLEMRWREVFKAHLRTLCSVNADIKNRKQEG